MLGFGAMMAVMNVKNLAVYLSAVDVLVRGQLPRTEAMLSVVAVTLVFSSYLLVPIGLSVVGGEQGRRQILRLRGWLEARQRRLGIGALSLFGVVFFGRGVSLLT